MHAFLVKLVISILGSVERSVLAVPKAKFGCTKTNQNNPSAPSCDCFGRHGEWKKIMATKITKKVAKLASVPPVDLVLSSFSLKFISKLNKNSWQYIHRNI